MPQGSSGQPWYNRMWMAALNGLLPGTPFNTHQSGPAGNAWASGDYSRAAAGDPYARARIAAGLLPGALGGIGEYGVTAFQNRGINNYENSPQFVGPPREGQSFGNESPYTYDNPLNMGPPTEQQQRQAVMPQFNPKTGMPRYSPGFGTSVNPNDALSMSMLMGSLGISGALGGGLGPDANAHMRPLVK